MCQLFTMSVISQDKRVWVSGKRILKPSDGVLIERLVLDGTFVLVIRSQTETSPVSYFPSPGLFSFYNKQKTPFVSLFVFWSI